MSDEHFKVSIFYIAITHLKIKTSIKAHMVIFLPSTLIIGKLTPK